MYSFSIKDLENLSGVKAHTIRIWEQRYNLLSPKRTETNIRYYDGNDLKLLLNVALLQEMGYKISRISEMSETEMKDIIQQKTAEEGKEKHLLNILKISMLNFDEDLFRSVTENYLREHSLEDAFKTLFIPFMQHVGLLWQTDAICPAQEHFVTNLIRQKIYRAIDELPQINTALSSEKTFVLFLPTGEIHDIGLLMMHYLIKLQGRRSVFLGSSVPLLDLQQVQQRLGDVNFVSFFTTSPSTKEAPKFLAQIDKAFASTGSEFYLSGWSLNGVESPNAELIKLYPSPDAILEAIL